MQDHHTHEPSSQRQLSLSLVAGLSALALVTGSAAAWWGWTTVSRQSTQPVGIEQTTPSTAQSGQGDSKAPAPGTTQSPAAAPLTTEKTLQVYWLKATDTSIALTPTPMKLTASGNSGLLKAAIEQLLAGQPKNQELSTTIPETTKLLSLTVKADGVHVDLSEDFTKGGGSTSMTARLGQMIYTASSLDPNAPVWLSVEGVPLDTLGGEGLLIDQPMTRKSFEQNFPL
ncbi:GerMN domain-containing protein [Pantanalinema sp. GBBB05]|uniref:GerMN domain-containing protein n=1 Tax=Pantanalinema sp. GBBB05 TaxID=2604139 RepID=UPI001DFBF9BB|nr:spore germination protein [Pantanalinema sp. GBBB05]